MKKTFLKHLCRCAISVILLLLVSAQAIFACATGRLTDPSTGWSFGFPENYTHAGTRSMTYYYNNSKGTSYATYFEQGKKMWGSKISLSRVSSSVSPSIELIVWDIFSFPYDFRANATTEPYSKPPPSHYKRWKILVNQENFDPLSSYQKNAVMAHEIGHAYGLGHVNSASQIMYSFTPSSSTKVRSEDLRGMILMTHERSCSSATSENTYERVDNSRHKKRCKACKSFVYEFHNNGHYCSLC